MARVIVHIGTHKTATTAIQRSLARNRAALARAGLNVPRLGPNPGHHLLAAEWVRLPVMPVTALRRRARAWARLEGLAARGEDVLLSAEVFSTIHPTAMDWAALRARLAAFSRMEVVVVLRDQQSLVQSLWLQIARHHAPPHPARMVARALAEGRVGPVPLDYPAFLGGLRAALPGVALHVLPYSHLCAAPDGPAAALLAALSLPLPPRGLAPLAEARPNAAPPPLEGWMAARAGAGMAPEDVALARAMLAARFGPGLRQSLLTRAEARALAVHFAPVNAALARMLGPGLAPDPCPGEGGADLFRCDLPGGIAAQLPQRRLGGAA
ncbi:MAG: hypothetical protein JJU40_00385 [Rhodobacteraceae bacterium]|nr:hypothetical protein [Paracoccaceae bacterium]